MKLVHPNSLAATLDALNEVFFMDRSLTRRDSAALVRWIVSRQGLKGAYCSMFAPTTLDFKRGIRLFTGERVVSGAAIGHILGEESSRALILLNGSSPPAKEALQKASNGMMKALKRSETRWKVRGFYCCGTCTASLWRNLAAGGLRQSKKRLMAGMKALKHYRDGNGKWRRFPFYYTMLTLTEIDLKSAGDEMRYAAPVCERYLRRYKAKNKLAKRRRFVMEKVLAKC
jgi:hypothetical protein